MPSYKSKRKYRVIFDVNTFHNMFNSCTFFTQKLPNQLFWDFQMLKRFRWKNPRIQPTHENYLPTRFSNVASPIHFLNPRKGHFIKVEFKVLQIDCEYGVNGFFLQEDEITSDAICGTNRQYAPIFSTDDELTLSFYNMREEVRNLVSDWPGLRFVKAPPSEVKVTANQIDFD